MTTYKEHYSKCLESTSIESPKRAYDLSIDTTFLDEVLDFSSYDSILKSLSKKISDRIDSGKGVVRKAAADYLDEWRDIPEMLSFANLVMPHIEEQIFGCHAHIQFVMPYRNIHDGTQEASWLWHYDDCPNEYLKFVVHLNDVDQENGCFQYLQEQDGRVSVVESKRKVPGKKGPQLYAGSRVPAEVMEEKIKQGAEIKSLTGGIGTYAMLTPNIFHRATVPKEGTVPRECIFFFIRPSIKKRESYVSSDTYSLLPDRDVKTYPLD